MRSRSVSKEDFLAYSSDPFVDTVTALRRRNEYGVSTDDVGKDLSPADRWLAVKGAEVLAHFGTDIPEYSPPEPVSGEIDV